MNRRRRILAGSLALVAMSLSFAETVLASVCAPAAMAAMDGTAIQAPVSAAMDGPADVDGAGMDCARMAGQDEGRRGAPDPNCPLSPAVGPGCTAVASLPGSSCEAALPPSHGVQRTIVDEARPDLLLSHALFRPPRA